MLRDLFSLFPACAGVIPVYSTPFIFFHPFPRMRGGDPVDNPAVMKTDDLFPACAGVIRNAAAHQLLDKPFPRMRGGDPHILIPYEQYSYFSPHARG